MLLAPFFIFLFSAFTHNSIIWLPPIIIIPHRIVINGFCVVTIRNGYGPFIKFNIFSIIIDILILEYAFGIVF